MEITYNKLANAKMLKTGEVKILDNNSEIIWTALGSCVSVIFHVPQKISLISHAQMPMQMRSEYNCFNYCTHQCFNDLPDFSDFKYVTCSIEYMINELVKRKINLRSIHTSVLGGASTIFGVEQNNSVGSQNIIATKTLLAKYKIRINRELVGGNYGITIWYNHAENKVLVNRHRQEGKFELMDIKFPGN